MLVQAQCSSSSTCIPHRFGRNPIFSHPVSFNVSQWSELKSARFGQRKKQRMMVSASDDGNLSANFERKRKVVEHICLLKAKKDLSEEEEKDMLDYLYTTQYQMGGVVAISLGCISDQNAESYTHAVYMRFQKKEDLVTFYENPFYLGVLKEHVMPYCHGLINVDYESEVEDDLHAIFRKGEEFNYGMEFVLLISFTGNALGVSAEHALASLATLTAGAPSLVVQSTQGLNFNPSYKEYTHGVVIRFRSVEAFEIFLGTTEYRDIWVSKFQPIIHKALAVHFSVDPVGTEIM
ncbi:Stress responsive alpha-beta barrel domain protein [Quillaja saponaria]|uniref:Stress responsive alpha-beta barrel domain protein n=1 Tax=Quillaja saponaria TaxID=32244 RepID=A0AAD7PEN8_QUISA|nr:Stress responsive alpha-beta barrel domain protein [Quillaja saponaria]